MTRRFDSAAVNVGLVAFCAVCGVATGFHVLILTMPHFAHGAPATDNTPVLSETESRAKGHDIDAVLDRLTRIEKVVQQLQQDHKAEAARLSDFDNTITAISRCGLADDSGKRDRCGNATSLGSTAK